MMPMRLPAQILRLVLVVSFLTLAFVLPARAGSWALTYEVSGDDNGMSLISGQAFDQPWSSDFSYSTDWFGVTLLYGFDYEDLDNFRDGQDMWAQVNSNGTATAVLTWQPSGTNDPPPTKVTLRVQGFAWGIEPISYFYDGDGVNAPTASADDGMQDGSATVALDSYGDYASESAGTHLIPWDNSSGQSVLHIPLGSPSAVGGSSYNVEGTDINITTNLDNRCPLISSSVDPTFFKSPVSARVGHSVTDQLENNVYEGKIHLPADQAGDVGLQLATQYSATNITYSVNYGPNWHTNNQLPTWSSSLTGAGSSPFDINPNLSVSYDNPCPPVYIGTGPDGNPIYDPAQDGVTGTDSITAQVTDSSDGASASPNYTMHVHNPDENPFLYRPTTKEFDAVPVASSAPAMYGANTQYTFTEPGADTSGNILATQLAAGALTSLPGYVQAIIALGGITPASLIPQQATYTTDFVTSWGTADSTWDGQPSPPAGAQMTDYEMTPIPEMRFVYNYVRADHYDTTGFTGQRDQTFHSLDANGFRCAGTFTSSRTP